MTLRRPPALTSPAAGAAVLRTLWSPEAPGAAAPGSLTEARTGTPVPTCAWWHRTLRTAEE